MINSATEDLKCFGKFAGALHLHCQGILCKSGCFVHPQDKQTHGGVVTSRGKAGGVGLPRPALKFKFWKQRGQKNKNYSSKENVLGLSI